MHHIVAIKNSLLNYTLEQTEKDANQKITKIQFKMHLKNANMSVFRFGFHWTKWNPE